MGLNWSDLNKLIEAAEKFADAHDRIATVMEKAYKKEFEDE
jgi:hypothetical protein